jgi:hypothetical protein
MRIAPVVTFLSFVVACSSSSGSTSPVVGDRGSDSSTPDGASSDNTTQTACDPLATHSTTLATILGVGKDASGTLYVADQGGIASDAVVVRVLVSSHGSLVRQDVIGAGSGGPSGDDLETFQSADGSGGARDLVINLTAGKATSMTLGAAGSGKKGDEGEDAGVTTSLTLVDPNTVKGLPVTDLPGAVQYVADAASGEAIVVTAPLENDVGTAAFHLFYGAPGAMVERPITRFEQALSGFPSIGFTVGAATYTMAIASIPSDGGIGEAPGPVTLTTGKGASVSYTLREPTPTTLTGFTFTCEP